MGETPGITRRDLLKFAAAAAVFLGTAKILRMNHGRESLNRPITEPNKPAEKTGNPTDEDLKKANDYRIKHHRDFEEEIKNRHPGPTKKQKRILEIEKEFRDFNLQLAEDNEGNWISTNPDIPHKTLPSPMPPLEESLRNELESPKTIVDPETGQKFTVLMLNWDKTKNPDEEILLTLPGFNNTAEPKWWNKHTMLKGEYIARQTGKPVLIIDHPGYGSEKLTTGQRKALSSKEDYARIDEMTTPETKLAYASNQGYGQIAQAQIRAIESLGLSNEFILFGGSMGAWSVAKIAEIAALRKQVTKTQQSKTGTTEKTQLDETPQTPAKPMQVNKLVLFDYPGVAKFTPWEMMKAMLTEAKLLTLYKTTHPDPKFREYTMQTAPGWKQTAGKIHEFFTTFTGDLDSGYKIAMGRPTIPYALSTAMESNPDLYVKLITGTESLLCPREANSAMYTELKQKFPARIYRELFPGETHLLMENPGRYAGTISRAIKPQYKPQNI